MAKGAIGVALLMLACAASAESVGQVLKVAQQLEGKFSSELPLPLHSLTVEVAVPAHWLHASYDHVTQALKFGSHNRVTSLRLMDTCTDPRTEVATTAKGKSKYKRLTCEKLTLNAEGDGVVLDDAEIAMTPDQYRDFKSRGLVMAVEFIPGEGAAKEVSEAHRLEREPSAPGKYGSSITLWELRGRMKSVAFLRIDTRELLARYSSSP